MRKAIIFGLSVILISLTNVGRAGVDSWYWDKGDFIDALDIAAQSYYEEDFSAYPGFGSLPSSIPFGPKKGFAYTISAASGLWSVGEAMSTNSADDIIVITFTGISVTAFGGYFYGTDFGGTPITATIHLTDGSQWTWDAINLQPWSFMGVTTTSPMASVTLTCSSTGAWPSLDDLIVGGEPEVLLVLSSTHGGTIKPKPGLYPRSKGDVVKLLADAKDGYEFSHWSGCIWDAGKMSEVTMESDCTIRANFKSLLTTIYVDDDAADDPGPFDKEESDPAEDGTPQHPFDSIQEAILVAGYMAKIIVLPGTYYEKINFEGKRITVTGLEGLSPGRPEAYPVIDSGGTSPTVQFNTRENADSVLRGFVITGGRTGALSGAIGCRNSSPTIANCLIVGNRTSSKNSAAVFCDGGSPTIVNCTIAHNVGSKKASGGGLYLQNCNAVVVNTIAWGNYPDDITWSSNSTPNITYSNSKPKLPGMGNTSWDPAFALPGQWDVGSRGGEIWVTGDYHLKSMFGRWNLDQGIWIMDGMSSPCINNGDPLWPLANEPFPNGGRINLGAYGGTTQASKAP